MDHYDSRSTTGVLYTVLERCIEDILSSIKPLESDRNERLSTIDEIASSIQSIETLKGTTVKPFGSFVANLYSKWGDLDISVTLDQIFNSSVSRRKKQNVLREIMRTLRKKGIGRKIQFIPQARVPLLVYESSLYGISCDLSVDNHQGRVKSKILQLITSFDERFTDMVLLIKEWAKAQNINDPKTGTMNSYSLCMLVIFHFQTCKPPILPPLKEIYSGNISDDVKGVDIEREREIEDICALNVQKIISHISSHRNQSSLTNLLVSFFDKFSDIEALSSEYIICPFTGRWERMVSNPRWTEKSYSLYIEDPFEQPDNTARAVGPHDLKTIAGVFHVTRQLLSSSSVLSDRSSLLRLLSRPLVSSRLIAPKKTTYTPQQANKHQYTNMYGIQQGVERVGYCVSGSAESSLNRDRTTRIRTTAIVDTYPNHSTDLINGSNLRQKGNQSEKPAYYSSYGVPEDQIHDPNLNRNYGIGLSDMNRFSQQANGSNPSQSNHRNHEVSYSAQYLDRPGQDYVANLNESHGTRSTFAVPNRDNLARNHRNNGIRFTGQTPERSDRHYDSSSSGMHRTGMASVEQRKDPGLIKNRQSQSHQRIGYSTTPPGNFDLNYDAGMNGMNGMHRSGLAIVESVTEQLNHSLKLNGQHSGSTSKKGKQIWQPKGASNQGFL
ncbi:poly(A) RNA polymerase cid11 isoform X2 [Carex littledalei]|uniref:Poly(A) RNA polymerase cid11 isoform X2 n=1 Tax=Carex littledalei TaxID=544730 RepID=A0A833QLK0_9POAL|nr:poly(A) RNA polymerase cid11 isoform X2 [Carex littledalei]